MFRTGGKTDPAPQAEPPRASRAPQADATEDRGPHGPTAGVTDGQPNTLLGRGSAFDGTLRFEGTVRIDGTFSGEIGTNDMLIIGEGATVTADITCGSVVINGAVSGTITATEMVELHKPAKVNADITTPSLMIEPGATFDGGSRMERAASVLNLVHLGHHDEPADG
jgi:cytoskeletal protein CcmA (bactofilin family)